MTPTTAPQMLVNAKGKPLTVSPSSLMDFIKSPHLYYLARKECIAWPRGAFPTLPDGMDETIKRHYDGWRPEGLPPEVRNFSVPGRPYPDQALVTRLRTRGKKGLAPVVVTAEVDGVLYGVTVQGEMDDLLLCDDGRVAVSDFKTKGTAPKGTEDAQKWYGPQFDAYALILEGQPKEFWGGRDFLGVYPEAFALYYYPDASPEVVPSAAQTGQINFGFRAQVVRVPNSAARAKALVQDIIRTLVGPLPELLGPSAIEESYNEAPQYLADYLARVARVGAAA